MGTMGSTEATLEFKRGDSSLEPQLLLQASERLLLL